MLRTASYCAALFGTILVVSCSGPPDLERRVTALEAANSDLASKLSAVEFSLKTLTSEEGTLDPTEKGFANMKANNWHFLVSSEDVVPYGDGQKVTLRIGNPYNITFKGFKITARYGTRAPEMPDLSDTEAFKKWSSAYERWQKLLRQKELSFTDELQPGRWNRVAMILAPAKAEEVGFIGIRISTNQVSLFGR